jgi:hypothetical protein
MSVSYPEASTKTSTARKIGREFALPSSGVKLPVDIQPAEVIDSSPVTQRLDNDHLSRRLCGRADAADR